MGLIKKVYAFYYLRRWKHVYVEWRLRSLIAYKFKSGNIFIAGEE